MAFQKNVGESSNSKHVNLNEGLNIVQNVSSFPECYKTQLDVDSKLHMFETELRKVDAFKLELPMCMRFLQNGIEKLSETKLKCMKDMELAKMAIEHNEKRKWMSSFQLCTTPAQYQQMCDAKEQLRNELLFKGKEGAFMAFTDGRDVADIEVEDVQEKPAEEEETTLLRPPAKQPKQQKKKNKNENENKKKKQRRCWSPELHQVFVDALDQIGGAEAATPKKILEKMKVDGLTNDEVKSHLQKYRVHLRKQASASSAAEPVNLSWLANKEVFDNDVNVVQENDVVEYRRWGKQVDYRF